MVYEYAMGTQIRVRSPATTTASPRRFAWRAARTAMEAYRGAHQLLIDHRDLLDGVAERLLDSESIEREEIVEIMRAHRERGGHLRPRA